MPRKGPNDWEDHDDLDAGEGLFDDPEAEDEDDEREEPPYDVKEKYIFVGDIDEAVNIFRGIID